MDMMSLRSWLTVALLILFVALVVKVFSKRNKAFYQNAANMIFDDEPKKQEVTTGGNENE